MSPCKLTVRLAYASELARSLSPDHQTVHLLSLLQPGLAVLVLHPGPDTQRVLVGLHPAHVGRGGAGAVSHQVVRTERLDQRQVRERLKPQSGSLLLMYSSLLLLSSSLLLSRSPAPRPLVLQCPGKPCSQRLPCTENIALGSHLAAVKVDIPIPSPRKKMMFLAGLLLSSFSRMFSSKEF